MNGWSARNGSKEVSALSTVTFTVTGMTCGHCAASVREEVASIPGVTTVDVDLASGKVNIASEGGVEPEAIQSAVEEAGYKLAS
jgi:copper chaperone CopZ